MIVAIAVAASAGEGGSGRGYRHQVAVRRTGAALPTKSVSGKPVLVIGSLDPDVTPRISGRVPGNTGGKLRRRGWCVLVIKLLVANFSKMVATLVGDFELRAIRQKYVLPLIPPGCGSVFLKAAVSLFCRNCVSVLLPPNEGIPPRALQEVRDGALDEPDRFYSSLRAQEDFANDVSRYENSEFALHGRSPLVWPAIRPSWKL